MRARTARDASDGKLYRRFFCPGCNLMHAIDEKWSFNGDHDRPTFRASVLVTYSGKDAGIDGAPPAICHSFVTDGRIEFCHDSTHSLSGRTVDLPELT